VVTETADDAPIPVSLVHDLCARWQDATSADQDAVIDLLGRLMASPRWHWHVTAPSASPPTDQSGTRVSECDRHQTIEMPIAMLQALWTWVLHDTHERASILRWWSSVIDSSQWEQLRALRAHRPRLTEREWYALYGYLSPTHLPDLVQETRMLLSSTDPNDQQMAMTILDRWLVSPDHETRTVAAQILHTWPDEEGTDDPVVHHHRLWAIASLAASGHPMVEIGRWVHVVDAMVRNHPSDTDVLTVLDRLGAAILTSTRPGDRVGWVTTLWTLVTDPTLPLWRRQTIATALHRMLHDPMVAVLVCDLLCMMPPLHPDPSFPASVWYATSTLWKPILEDLVRTSGAGAILEIIDKVIRQDRNAIAWLDRIVAAGWGNGHDQRILQMITSHPSSDWREVLRTGITTSVGKEVCAFMQLQVPPDQAIDTIVTYVLDRDDNGTVPLAPLPEHLIPWVCAVARSHPEHLPSNTIRRIWMADPKRAWNVTTIMLASNHPTARERALAAMDTGWGTGHDVEMATTLRSIILEHQDHLFLPNIGIATAISGIGRADPSLIAPLLTELAMQGNENVRRWLIRELHRGWGRGQDALVLRIVEMIAERDPSEWVWDSSHETLARAWDHLPSHVVVSLIDRLLTHVTNRATNDSTSGVMAQAAIAAALAPGWTYLPSPQVIERIAHHVAHLHAHAHSIDPSSRNTLVAAWARVIVAGADRLSAADIHAVLSPLWTLSPDGYLDGVRHAMC
jgi:hypothetical protein